MSKISICVGAIFATEIDSIAYSIFFTVPFIFQIHTSQNPQLRKAFLRATAFCSFTAALTGTKRSLVTRSGDESESTKGPGYHQILAV